MGQFAIPIALGSQLLGAGLSYGENRAANARSRQTAASAAAIGTEENPANPYITSTLNSGQDSFLQFLRANPQGLQPFQFDTSKSYADLQAERTLDTQTQVNGLRSSAGSLGQRYGTGFASKETDLRSRIAAGYGAQDAQIAQSSFNTALNAGLSDFQGAAANRAQLLSLLSGNFNTGRQQQLSALNLGSSQPYPGFGETLSNTGTGIGQLLLLSQYLNRTPGAGTAPTTQRLPGVSAPGVSTYPWE